jgi:uncharacterized protein YggU (UPF0235/DUF167 family)
MRITLWVRPRSGRSAVGGDRAGALVVRVRAAPEHGAATDEALAVLAGALGVRRGAVRLVSGHTSRIKQVEVGGDPSVLVPRVAALRAAAPGSRDRGPQG